MKIRHRLCRAVEPWAPLALWRGGLLLACGAGLALAAEPTAASSADAWSVAVGAGTPWAVVGVIGWRALAVVEHLVRVIERAVDGATKGDLQLRVDHRITADD